MTDTVDLKTKIQQAYAAAERAGYAHANLCQQAAAEGIRETFPTARFAAIDVWQSEYSISFNAEIHLILGPANEVLWHSEDVEFGEGGHDCGDDCPLPVWDPQPAQQHIECAELAVVPFEDGGYLDHPGDDLPGHFGTQEGRDPGILDIYDAAGGRPTNVIPAAAKMLGTLDQQDVDDLAAAQAAAADPSVPLDADTLQALGFDPTGRGEPRQRPAGDR